MKKTTFALMFVILSGTTLWAQSNDEKAVEVAVESLRKAMVDGNEPLLKGITAKDLTYGHSSGLMEDQNAFVTALASGKSDFVSIELKEQTITVLGDIALVRHKLFGDSNSGGKPSEVKLGVLLVWQKQQGQWRLLARQAYKL
jgi:hypothetical protein